MGAVEDSDSIHFNHRKDGFNEEENKPAEERG